MFASQLLRILETVPADVNYETRVFDIPTVKLTMKENQNEISCPSNGFEKKADSLASKMDNENASWNSSVVDCSEVVDRSTNSDDKEVTDCQELGDQEGPLCLSNEFERDLNSLTVNDQTQSNSEIERSIIIDSCADRGEKGAGDSETPCPSVSQFEYSQTNFYADKSVRECEVPEVMVCYKDSDYHMIKDICVDEGLPAQEKTVIETDKDGHTGLFVSQPAEDKQDGTAKGCHGIEPGPDGFEVTTVEHTRNCVFSEDRTKEVDVATYISDGSKAPLEDAVKDVMKVPGNLKQLNEANWRTAERTDADISEDDVSDNESSASSRNSSQESIAQDAHQHSSKDDEIEAPQQIDEVPSVEASMESLAVAFASDDPKKNVAGNNLLYNSKVEGSTITFDFNSSKLDASAENSHKEFLEAEDANGKEGSLDDNSAATLPQHTSDAEKAEDVNGKDGNSVDNSAATLPQPTSNAEKAEDVNGKHGDLDDNSASTLLQHLSNAEKNENVDHSRQLHRGGEESSFSSCGPVSGLITYSGPIAYSGSISLRSDSSTTSTRSFAFPVLQSEWNSSPVRMVKADRRHFRKHRGWRQGLFCCRF